MTTVVKEVDLQSLREYKEKNLAKFTHKYGEIDFNNLPEGFEGKLPFYKSLVAKERARREIVGASQDVPAITPWTIFPKPEVVDPAPVVEVAPVAPVAHAPEVKAELDEALKGSDTTAEQVVVAEPQA